MKTSSEPVSVRLDPELKRKATAYARRKKVGLTTALRMIISEHLEQQEDDAELEAARRWQYKEALKTYERWRAGKEREYSVEEVLAEHDREVRKARKR